MEDMHWIYQLAIILIGAKISGEAFQRLRVSPVIGEILAGVVLGGALLGLIPDGPDLHLFAEMGIIFMILLIGLETHVSELRRIGKTAFMVAVMGIIIPFGMGYILGEVLGYTWKTSLFLGSILTATSVAVTVRTFMDLGQARSSISQTILAAAIIDDILGLLVLALVLAFAGMGEEGLATKLERAGLFFFIILPLGWWLVPWIIALVRKMKGEGSIFTTVLGMTFLFSYLSHWAGLASLIGAFLIGLIFGQLPEAEKISEEIKILYYFLAPIFFVSIGVQVDIQEFSAALAFALLLTLVAIISKIIGGQAGAYLGGLNLKKGLIIGVGMVPRGEVGLIIAGIGRQWHLIDDAVFSASAFMCLLTILIPPLLIKLLIKLYPEELEGK
jgi:Kef-type K+ transport system membrane component KefB